LYDLGYISFDEPYKKLVNQGMIQGSSRFVYRYKNEKNLFVSRGERERAHISWFKENRLKDLFEVIGKETDLTKRYQLNSQINYSITAETISDKFDKLHVDVNIVDGVELDIEAFKKWKPEYANAEFILEDGKYICGVETEKMSKSKYNTINPNDIVDKYGADTFRMYEMFLGPVEQSKPWDTKGIEGVHRFLKKLWRLFYNEETGKIWTEEKATDAELKTLHKTIKKIEEDTERFSFNTAVSAFMVCINELTDLKCHKKEILEPLLVLLTPYAPHIAEELYHALGNTESVLNASYPRLENK
jgi:leucyl-tRNA synthetase